MAIEKSLYGTLSDGTEVTSWLLTNENGLQAEVLDYGATIRSIIVPDKNGQPLAVVLGYDTLEEYVSDTVNFGVTVGRFANRIKNACFELNGKTYHLFPNDGMHHLHGGKRGFSKYVWEARQEGNAVLFSRISPDGEEGYPGNLSVRVTIGWEGNSLTIRYEAETDRDTILNLTNHSYFNLNGAGNGRIENHTMQIRAPWYTPNGADCIPTGEIVPVDGSAMDFRVAKTLGRDMGNDEPCVKMCEGYNGNLILDGHPAAITAGDISGITMVTDTDQPGIQLYTANEMGDMKGKDGKDYGFHTAFCLETQHYPDCIHQPQWPTCILRAGETFRSFTTYTFEV